MIAELENKVKAFIEEKGIDTCRKMGLFFDGSTESFLKESMLTKVLIRKIKDIAKEIELKYDSKFQKITSEEALIIGDRSKSFAQKRAIDSTIYKLEAKNQDKIKTAKTSKGYSHV